MSAFTSLRLILPELFVGGGLILLLVWDLLFPRRRYWEGAAFAFSFLAVATWFLVERLGLTPTTVFGVLRIDALAALFQLVAVVACAATIGMNLDNARFPRDRGRVETQVLLMGATLGAMVMVATHHLMVFYLGFEAVSLCSYALANVHKRDRAGAEAAMKYVVYGALASAVMLYGMSLWFGLGGGFDFRLIAIGVHQALNQGNVLQVLLPTLLVLVGFGYKLGVVPFQWWVPDVYQGTTTPIASFLATASKVTALAALVRLTTALFDGVSLPQLSSMLGALAVASMLFGGLAALRQQHLRRLLAYSSIGHAGFLLAGVSLLAADSQQAVLLYGLVYAVLSIGIFAGVLYFTNRADSDRIDDLRGLGRRHPWAGAALVTLLAGLIGLPPTAGFSAKWLVFSEVLATSHWGLAAVMLISAMLSAGYSFRILRSLFLDEPESEGVTKVPPLPILATLLALTTLLTLWWLDLDPLVGWVAAAGRDLVYW